MNPKRFFLATLATTLALVAAVWLVAIWLHPIHGDLTRIGGFAERDFGGNEPMQEFRPTPVTFGAYQAPADILVIGDSFANAWPYQQWQNWLAGMTGWRIHTMHVDNVDLAELTNSRPFRQFPPKVVIWNIVERELLDELGNHLSNCRPARPTTTNQTLDMPHPVGIQPFDSSRPRYVGLNPGFVRIWAWRTAFREYLGINDSDALSFKLARNDLFSSKNADELLIYRNDLRKKNWRSDDLKKIQCGFSILADGIQANGVTRLVSAIAPDKSTAYRPWLADPSALPESHLATLLARFPIPDARLDRKLALAIAGGTKDVYMPNDTHWNATGQKLVAHAILDMLKAEGLTR